MHVELAHNPFKLLLRDGLLPSTPPGWSLEDSDRALAEGWDVFCYESDPARPELQVCGSAPGRFAGHTDDHVIALVEQRAAGGCAHAQRALLLERSWDHDQPAGPYWLRAGHADRMQRCLLEIREKSVV